MLVLGASFALVARKGVRLFHEIVAAPLAVGADDLLGGGSGVRCDFVLGLGGAAKAISSVTEDTVRKAGGAARWLVGLLIIALAVLAAWYFLFASVQ